MAASLLSALALLGSPGCGCGDDFPDEFEEFNECCCTFEWIMEQTGPGIVDVNIVLTNADPSLYAVAIPSQLLGVSAGVPRTFQICVRDTHNLGASVDVEFRSQATSALLGAARLTYSIRCLPTITPLTVRMILTSPDCAGACCCTFQYLVPPDVSGTVEIEVEAISAGFYEEITPEVFTSVVGGQWLTFEVCVNDDHPVPSNMTLAFVQGGEALLARVLLLYNEPCLPTIEPLEGITPFGFFSPDCGEVPVCCCDIEWTVTDPDWVTQNVTASLANADPSLGATLAPTVPVPVTSGGTILLTLCVEATHDLGAEVDIVIRNAAGAEVDRMNVSYDQVCLPTPETVETPNDGTAGFFSFLCLDGGFPIDAVYEK